jgi:glycosyltransferase involved in cell wall biosynthesis
MRILSINYKDYKGGFTKRLYRLYREVADSGNELHFIGTQKLPFEHNRIIQYISEPPFGLEQGALFWIWFMISSIFRSFYLCRKKDIERLIVFGPFYAALCILPVKLSGVKAFTFVRADNMQHSSNRLRNLFFYYAEMLGVLISDKVIFVNSSLCNVYKKRYFLADAKCLVQPNSIEQQFLISTRERDEIRASQGLGNKDFVISTSGAFTKDKNFSFIIEALHDLKEMDIKLLIIGDEQKINGERKRLENMSERYGLTNEVIFTGWRDNPIPLLLCSDLFVFPTKHEGSPNSLLEALACGLPCLGSDIDEIKEHLIFSELRFSLSDTNELAGKIKTCIFDEKYFVKLKTLSNECKDRLVFNWSKKVLDIISD